MEKEAKSKIYKILNNLKQTQNKIYYRPHPGEISDNPNLKIDNMDYKIPFFLVSKKFNDISRQELYEGLNFCRNLMENKFFIPNNIKFPKSRILLENKFLKVN